MKKTTLTLLSALLVTTALASCGKTGTKKVGILQFGSFDALTKAKDGFVEGLSEAGFTDGSNIEIKVLNPEADSGSNKQMADTLAAGQDLVYGIATPSATALKNSVDSTGRNIPVVFSAVTDPVGAKLVASLEKPGANVTGMSDLGPIEKELDLLDLFSGIDKVATLITATESNSIYQEDIAKTVLAKKGLTEVAKSINNATEISAAVTSIPSDVDALWIPTDDTIAANMATIKSAVEGRTTPLIVMACDVGMISGSIIAMGVDYEELGKQAGEKAAKILNGADPASIPVETADKSVISINQTWATKIGLTLPEALLKTEGAKVI